MRIWGNGSIAVECGFSCWSRALAFVSLCVMGNLSLPVAIRGLLAGATVCISCCVWPRVASGVSGPWDKEAQQVGPSLSDFLWGQWPLKKRISRGRATPALPLHIFSSMSPGLGDECGRREAPCRGGGAGASHSEKGLHSYRPIFSSQALGTN